MNVQFNQASLTVTIDKNLVSAIVGETATGARFEQASMTASTESNGATVKIGTPVARDYSSVPEYTGEYTIIPKADEAQILQTKDKRMTDDLTVTKVPYFETSNEHGKTIYIASEVV